MTDPARRFLKSTWVPWRVRNRLERLLETRIRKRWAALYRLAHHGRVRDLVEPITRGPAHHFFGYYDKSPWARLGQWVLAHEAEFNDRPPAAEDEVAIGLVDPIDGTFHPVARTLSWNWQQGSMLQWHPAKPGSQIVHNACARGRAYGVIRDLQGAQVGEIDRPVYALSPDARCAYSVSFSRLQRFRPGYGYAGLEDPTLDSPHPDNDGLFRVDLHSGRAELTVSLDELARLEPLPSMEGEAHWLNHVQVSPGGKRVAFFHTWSVGDGRWAVRLYVLEADSGALRRVLDTGVISHYDWRNDEELLVWAARPDGAGRAFLLIDVRTGDWRAIGPESLTEDGHCSFSPDGRWVLNDTYPDPYDMRTLMLFRWPDGPRIDLARLHSPRAAWPGEIRCDLHPRWSPDGSAVCIDSVHDGTRQMYRVDVSRFTQ